MTEGFKSLFPRLLWSKRFFTKSSVVCGLSWQVLEWPAPVSKGRGQVEGPSINSVAMDPELGFLVALSDKNMVIVWKKDESSWTLESEVAHVATEQVRGHADSDLTANVMHCFRVYL